MNRQERLAFTADKIMARPVFHDFSAARLDYVSAFLWLDHAYDWINSDPYWPVPVRRAVCALLIDLRCGAQFEGLDFGDPKTWAPPPPLYGCSSCRLSFDTREEWQEHRDWKHPEKNK